MHWTWNFTFRLIQVQRSLNQRPVWWIEQDSVIQWNLWTFNCTGKTFLGSLRRLISSRTLTWAKFIDCSTSIRGNLWLYRPRTYTECCADILQRFQWQHVMGSVWVRGCQVLQMFEHPMQVMLGSSQEHTCLPHGQSSLLWLPIHSQADCHTLRQIILRSKPYQPISKNLCRVRRLNQAVSAKFAAILCTPQLLTFLCSLNGSTLVYDWCITTLYFSDFYRVDCCHV